MKAFEIDIEKVLGAEVIGQQIEVTGTMSVRRIVEVGAGFESKICLDLTQALSLLEALTGAVKIALIRRGNL